ncbi:T9SS type A sorting domain-containing protein [Spirosoma sp. KNUC1025]|nr:T9SS type A sorting domain-containing protein [Spirosoma sp. KNUC1025]
MEAAALTPNVIAHELAHQWFGDKITCRNWQNIWLNEGFASYAEAVYTEAVNGQSGYTATINSFMSSARSARGSIYVQDITNFANIFSSSRTYAKGATVLHMLRGIVGDSTFYRIMRTYAASPTVAYQTAVTEDFQAIAQQVSGRNLDPFFKQWIYGEGYPTYRTTITSATSATAVTVRLEQRNTVSSNPASFTMPVQMWVQSASGDTIITVLNNQADQTFTLPARGSVTGVVVDPNNWILKTVESTTVVTGLSEPTPIDLRIYPNPASETLSVNFSLSSASPVTLSLTNLLGQQVRTVNEPTLVTGPHTRTMSLRGLARGQYTVTIETQTGKQSRVVLLQ